MRRCRAGAIGLLLLTAAPAWSAQIVDIRIGHHPNFARVVFELDAPTGYRVERHAPVPGIGELVITVDASSAAPGSLSSRDKSLVEGVDVVVEGNRSVAHIRLARDGLKLKEMILANPPRIVLDVLGEKPPPAPKPVAAPKPKPKPAAARAPTPRRQPPPKPKPAAGTKPAAPAAPGATGGAPPGGAEARQLSLPRVPTGSPPSPSSPAPAASRPPPKPAAAARDVPTAAKPVPKPASPPRARTRPQPAAVPPPSTESFLTGNTAMAIGAAVVLVAAVAGFLWWRRSSTAMTEEEFDAAMGEDDPFAGLEAAPDEAGTADTEEFSLSGGVADTGTAAAGTEKSVEGKKRAGASGPRGGTDVEEQVVSENASTVIMDSQPPQMGAMDAGVTRMLREFERRIASLETRLDEAVDARERLERQVAAQTEELRVQRAAIARTQRAVRNLSRPEEDSSPTEPALRDPKRPDGPRS